MKRVCNTLTPIIHEDESVGFPVSVSTVLVNGSSIACLGNFCSIHSDDGGVIDGGCSLGVLAEGIPIALDGATTSCEGTLTGGSPNVFASIAPATPV